MYGFIQRKGLSNDIQLQIKQLVRMLETFEFGKVFVCV